MLWLDLSLGGLAFKSGLPGLPSKWGDYWAKVRGFWEFAMTARNHPLKWGEGKESFNTCLRWRAHPLRLVFTTISSTEEWGWQSHEVRGLSPQVRVTIPSSEGLPQSPQWGFTIISSSEESIHSCDVDNPLKWGVDTLKWGLMKTFLLSSYESEGTLELKNW